MVVLRGFRWWVLAGLLDRSFTARVSAGMPLGVGGAVPDPKTMLVNVWGAVSVEYDVAPYPEEFVDVDRERVSVFGAYRGTARRHRHFLTAVLCARGQAERLPSMV
ncbi:hypothetical protein ACFWUP_00405 [Nocardia sp. NPDC058658]|uniref:hypothetical protein n=1 Tax=Nocardia sp. NPDC058658 TaxID=3346580 RepID=UPI00364755D7